MLSAIFWPYCLIFSVLTHWGRVTHIYVSVIYAIIGSDNGFLPGRRQAVIWTSAWILLIQPLGTNLSEIWIKMHIFSFNKMHFKMSSGKMSAILSWPQCVTQHVDDLGQDCSNSIANTLELLQSCTKPSMSGTWLQFAQVLPRPFMHSSLINSSLPVQNGRHSRRRHFQMHFLEWKW